MDQESSALNSECFKLVKESKIFVVGAGGIGCELLKNLVLTGFRNLEVIDLDTIDVSNLNRQFLFQKKHVGKPKVKVAAESCERLCPDVNIVTYHDSIFNPDFNMNFFKKFDIVLNALDNRAARSHVNKMCLAANVPMIESASEGYMGQVTVIRKNETECYDCTPKARQRTFPGCTIRNTPSELIHCVVWAKYLFNQLFGEPDVDEDVSPDTADPEALDVNDSSKTAKISNGKENGNENGSGDSKDKPLGNNEVKSTRKWAEETCYDPGKIFNKLFKTDIEYLLSMGKLWEKRKPPVPVNWQDEFLTAESDLGNPKSLDMQRVPSFSENAALFAKSVAELKGRLAGEGDAGTLVWDKDDEPGMNFVSSAANIRAHIFHIPQKSHFEIKSMAGNIIPAIATTNAIVAGLIVMQALCVIQKQFNKCKTVYVRRFPNPSKRLLDPNTLEPPNPKCYVCTDNPEITIKLNTKEMTVLDFQEKVLKSRIGMLAPDVRNLDGTGTQIVISSEEGELDENYPKILNDVKVVDGTRLHADDFLQNYEIIVNIVHSDNLDRDTPFEVVSESGELGPKQDETEKKETRKEDKAQEPEKNLEDDEDDLIMINEEDTINLSKKRKPSDNDLEKNIDNEAPAKRRKLSNSLQDDKDDLIMVE